MFVASPTDTVICSIRCVCRGIHDPFEVFVATLLDMFLLAVRILKRFCPCTRSGMVRLPIEGAVQCKRYGAISEESPNLASTWEITFKVRAEEIVKFRRVVGSDWLEYI